MILLVLTMLLSAEFDSIFRDGLIALNRNDLSVARDRLEAAAKLNPESGEAWTALAQTLLKLGNTQASDEAAEKALSVSKGNARVLRALLLYYSGRALPDRVIDVAQRALVFEDRPDLHQALGKAYFEQGEALLQKQDFDAAAKSLEAGRNALPGSAQLELALGVTRYAQRRFPEAVELFLHTIQLAPEVEQPYIFLGKILDHAGNRLPEIQQRFDALRAKNPEDSMANFLGAKALLAQAERDDNEAIRLLRKSIEIKETFWESHFELGVLLARLRQFSPSAKELQRAVELNPGESAPHYHLARVYDRLGKPDLAAAERAIHEKLGSRTDIK